MGSFKTDLSGDIGQGLRTLYLLTFDDWQNTYLSLVFGFQLLECKRAHNAIRDDQRDEHDVREDERKELPGHAQGRRALAALLHRRHRRLIRGHRVRPATALRVSLGHFHCLACYTSFSSSSTPTTLAFCLLPSFNLFIYLALSGTHDVGTNLHRSTRTIGIY